MTAELSSRPVEAAEQEHLAAQQLNIQRTEELSMRIVTQSENERLRQDLKTLKKTWRKSQLKLKQAEQDKEQLTTQLNRPVNFLMCYFICVKLF